MTCSASNFAKGSRINMERQDAQDKQDERLLHENATRPKIRCGHIDAEDYKTPDS